MINLSDTNVSHRTDSVAEHSMSTTTIRHWFSPVVILLKQNYYQTPFFGNRFIFVHGQGLHYLRDTSLPKSYA